MPRNDAISNPLGPGPEDPSLWDQPLTPWDRFHPLGPGPREFRIYRAVILAKNSL